MADLNLLQSLVFENPKAPSKPLSRLGYFCKPFRPDTGPFSNKVIKVYQCESSKGFLKTLVQRHNDYLGILSELNVYVPKTEMHLIENGAKFVPVIVQDAIEPKFMMRQQIQIADMPRTIELMEAAGLVIAQFWNKLTSNMGRVGFHPSIRNFAVIDKKAVFFDSFPPLIHYNHAEIGSILITFSESRLIRILGPIFPKKIACIQDEWYSPSETFIGLVGSACRLRPNDSKALLAWGRQFATLHMPDFSNEIFLGLQQPPKLPRYWTNFRKLLRLQGEPNL